MGFWAIQRLFFSFCLAFFGRLAGTVISGGRIMPGGYEGYTSAGAPTNGTSEVQTLTKSGTLSGGTFKLSFRGEVTGALNYNASAANIVAALEALPSIGTGGVTATGGTINSNPVVVTFAGNLGKRAITELIALAYNSLTGSSPSIGIAETTAGVDASGLGAPAGAELIDTTNGAQYINVGTAAAPDWQRVSAGPSGVVPQIAKVALAALDTGGGVLSWQNPEGVAIIIQRVELDTSVVATAACTIDVGTTASSATTTSDNLIDGLDVNAALGTFDNITDKGTNGKSRQKLAAGKWVTGTKASGAAAGLAGYAYIHYHRA